MAGFRQDPSFLPFQTINFDPFLYDVKQVNGVDCGKVLYKLAVFNSTSPAPSWMTL